jgi:molecular chaperone GrpE
MSINNDEIFPENENIAENENPLLAKITELEEKNQQLDDQLKRSMADYQNLLRRTQQEKEQIRLYAAEPAMLGLIPALDNFHYAIKSFSESSDSNQLFNSMKMIWGNLISTLDSIGFKLIDKTNIAFDAMSHEAITQIPAEEEGLILEIFRPGYSLHGKVLKPAQVGVSVINNKQ